MQTTLPIPENEIAILKEGVLLKKVALLEEKNVRAEEEISRLYEIIRKLKKQAFGPTKERWISGPEQPSLFDEVEVAAQKSTEETSDEDVTTIESHTRRRGKRKPLPENLPREVLVVELKPEEQFSDDGTPLKVIGKEVSEKLVYTPATMKVLEIHRLKYGLAPDQYLMIAPTIPSIIPKGIATPSLLAGIIVNKYADGLPLYRQEEIFKRHGIELSRSSMARWVVQSAQACMPLLNVLNDRLMEEFCVSCDETHVQVLKENGRKAESKSWMWVRATPVSEHKIVLFDYDPHRSAKVAHRLLSEYRGFFQVDGYDSYNCLENNEDLIRLGCNMHGRRKFFDAHESGAKSGTSLADAALKYYKTLYQIEEKICDKSPEERFIFRLEHAGPVWKDFEKWAKKNQSKVPPKSKIGQALSYFINEIDYLRGYLMDGRLSIDNGFVERAIKYFAIGRNNWLFSDTEDGAEASSLFYSLIVTAKLNGVNPFDALETIFNEIPKAKTLEDVERLADLLLNKRTS
jgi:transposase